MDGLTVEVRVTVPVKLKVLLTETDRGAPVAPELKLTGPATEIVNPPT